MIPEAEALGYWRRAAEEPVGLALQTDHRRNLITRLFEIKVKYKDEDFSDLVVAYGTEQDEVWIIRRDMHKLKAEPIKPMSEADIEAL
jgi:hypothetical protein